MKKLVLTLVGGLALLIVIGLIRIDVQPSHDTPWSPPGIETRATAADGTFLYRTILIGDAGSSTLDPLEASLAHAADLAAEAPEQTTVVMLGDNIYMRGFPSLEDGQESFDEEQLEDISHLDAQLEIARRSGAKMVFVPGNHDWYAIELNGQANYITERSVALEIKAAMLPAPDAPDGKAHLPVARHLPGLSHIYFDSQWMIVNSQMERDAAASALDKLIRDTINNHPDNAILLLAHHPLETMGPHAHYYTDRVYPLIMQFFALFFEDAYQGDVIHEDYKAYIASIRQVLLSYPSVRSIFAGGHDHNLQVFGSPEGNLPEYRLVSGSGSLDKVTGVGHNDNTQFAVAQQGFMTLDTYEHGVLLRVFTSTDRQEVFSRWLFSTR